MARSLATKIRSAARMAGRCGRPRRELAGEVDERILEAARKVFLERGFEGASVEEIAEAARSGKPTIYARYPNKRALFAAAYASAFTAKNARLASHTPAGTTLEERLTNLGEALLHEVLTGEWIGLIRLAIAEAQPLSRSWQQRDQDNARAGTGNHRPALVRSGARRRAGDASGVQSRSLRSGGPVFLRIDPFARAHARLSRGGLEGVAKRDWPTRLAEGRVLSCGLPSWRPWSIGQEARDPQFAIEAEDCRDYIRLNQRLRPSPDAWRGGAN